MRLRVAIVGGGAAGIVSSKIMRDEGFEVTCFEKSDSIGGTWKYIPNDSVMYGSLRTNLPKEIMGFSKEDPILNADTSFITHKAVLQYLQEYSTKYSVHECIRFNSLVVNIDRSLNDDGWVVKSKIIDGKEFAEIFDAVIICNGHYNTPLIPEVPGKEYFKGVLMHSCDFDDVDMYRDKRVLIVGGKSSATDLAREISIVASEVLISERNYNSPSIQLNNIVLHGGLERITEDGGVQFIDGDVVHNIDVILWSTGYLYDFPFLRESSVLKDYAGPTRSVRGLYQLLFASNNPSIAFIGLPYSVVPFPIFYLQAHWISSVLSGKSTLPNREAMNEWVKSHEQGLRNKGWYETKYHYLGERLQFDYMRSLAQEAQLNDQEVTMAYTDMLQSIYFDNSAQKPAYIGGDDIYRSRRYHVDRSAVLRVSLIPPLLCSLCTCH